MPWWVWAKSGDTCFLTCVFGWPTTPPLPPFWVLERTHENKGPKTYFYFGFWSPGIHIFVENGSLGMHKNAPLVPWAISNPWPIRNTNIHTCIFTTHHKSWIKDFHQELVWAVLLASWVPPDPIWPFSQIPKELSDIDPIIQPPFQWSKCSHGGVHRGTWFKHQPF